MSDELRPKPREKPLKTLEKGGKCYEMLGVRKVAKKVLTKGVAFDILTPVAARERERLRSGGAKLENDTERNGKRTVRFLRELNALTKRTEGFGESEGSEVEDKD